MLQPHGLFPSALRGAVVFSAYTFFLYLNFSGYIDVVIGLGSLLGLRLPENFDRPFSSAGFIEFWSRWHITLSAWLKDYVYLPLISSLMRPISAAVPPEPYLGTAAYFVTFFLVGIWHGQTSEFFFFGFLQGAGVAANKLFQVLAAQRMGRKSVPAGIFRQPRLRDCSICRPVSLLPGSPSPLHGSWSDWKQIRAIYAALGPGGTACSFGPEYSQFPPFFSHCGKPSIRRRPRTSPGHQAMLARSRYSKTAWTTALLLVVLVTSALLDQPVPEIVYGKF